MPIIIPEMILSVLFAGIILLFLVVDLGFLSRYAHKVSTKSAVAQSIFWVTVSLLFAGCIWALLGADKAMLFVSSYVTEKMLSVDNLFVILLIFGYFKLKEEYYHKVLFWGIFGAVVLRGLFIGAGSLIIGQFHWVLYFFGAFLVYNGFKLLFKKDDDEGFDVEKSRVLKFARRWLPIYFGEHHGKFIVKSDGRYFFTSLALILLVVETTDIIFAFDSIPAVFSITQDPFIAFTSNIFAVMGLRALFFLVEKLMKKLTYLQYGLSIVLIFIGAKMFTPLIHFEFPAWVSLLVVLGVLVLSACAPILFGNKHKKTGEEKRLET